MRSDSAADGRGWRRHARRLWHRLPRGLRHGAWAPVIRARLGVRWVRDVIRARIEQARQAPLPDRRPPRARRGVAVAGELTLASGLGESARLMAQVLETAGVRTWMLDVTTDTNEPAPPPHTVRPPPQVPPRAAPLIIHANPSNLDLCRALLPRAALRHRRVIGYWAWELTEPPPHWREGLSRVHEVWVPSRFTANAIARLFPPDRPPPLRVVPHALAAAPPRPAPLGRAAFGLPEEPTVVVLVSANLSSRALRKNPQGAIEAFRLAFGDRPDRLLVLKLTNVERNAQDFAAVRAAIGGARNIRLETRTFPTADSHALTACADIVLSLHRSEGFGLVPAEAMLLGRPVVATGWSGNMDYMDARSAALVSYRLVEAEDPRGVFAIAGGHWAQPNTADAARHLRRLADDPAARTALGAAGKAMATQRLGSDALIEAVRAIGLKVPRRTAAGVTTGGGRILGGGAERLTTARFG